MNKKGQFLLLSIAVLILAMYGAFQYIESSSETSSILFQPSFSEEANNLFRSITSRSEWIEEEWYNFSLFQARINITAVIPPGSTSAGFNISVKCEEVCVVNSSNKKKIMTKQENDAGSMCKVKFDDPVVGDKIYYYFKNETNITAVINISLNNASSPLYYRGANLRSKLCDHISGLYTDRQIRLDCAVY